MNKKELDFILQEGEGQFIEFKESFDNSLAKEIIAFANASGGKIFLGINDNNEVKGIKITNKLKSQILDIARNCDPSIKIKLSEFKNILIIDIFEGKDKPYRCSSGFYLRSNANSQKMKRNEILDFITKVSKVFFDELPCTKLKQIDKDKFLRFLKLSNLSNVSNINDILLNFNLAKKEKNKLIYNNACALLFAKDLNKIYFHTVVTCVKFKGNDRSIILDRKDFNKGIINNIEDAINFILQYLPLRYKIKGLQREEFYEIPKSAIREGVVNAIIHRDYFEKGANVQINIFDDTLEITNPGGLVAGLNPKDFGKKSISRNPLLLNVLSRTHFVEKIGSGIKRIRKAVRDSGLKMPKFSFDNFFTLTFYRDKNLEKTVDKTVDKIIQIISNNPQITQKELEKLIGLSRRGIEWNLSKMKKQGVLKRVGSKKTGHWKIIK